MAKQLFDTSAAIAWIHRSVRMGEGETSNGQRLSALPRKGLDFKLKQEKLTFVCGSSPHTFVQQRLTPKYPLI